LVIEFLDLGLGRLVQRQLLSIYCGQITEVQYWRLWQSSDTSPFLRAQT
jgi:hypothetical protein